MNTGTAANPIASGNLLNWITMSRQDVAKKILIGGRAATGISSPGAYNAATVPRLYYYLHFGYITVFGEALWQ